jgi:glycosyltransferase involved in cell wall biosynthesis
VTAARTAVRLAVRDVGTYGGIGRYVAELVDGLRRSDDVDLSLVVVGPVRSPWAAEAPRLRTPSVPLGGSLALLRLPRDRRVLHFPLHETTPLFAASAGRIVMTIHSVEPMYMPRTELALDGSVSKLPFRLLRATRRRLARVITPSAYEAARIEEHLHIPTDRIDVIPHGVRHEIFNGHTRTGESAPDRPYLLYVGHHQPQKNVARLIRAFVSLGLADVDLLIGGEIGECADSYRDAAGDSRNVRYLGRIVDDVSLAGLYRNALGFCYPSLHESFGLPVLEAMACGCPVAAARGSGLEETVGQAGLLFDPRAIDEIAERLAELVEGAPRSQLTAAGIQRAAGFTWRRSVQAHVTAYEIASQ